MAEENTEGKRNYNARRKRTATPPQSANATSKTKQSISSETDDGAFILEEVGELNNPLAEPTFQRDYATAAIDPTLAGTEIPEADFKASFNIPDPDELAKQYGGQQNNEAGNIADNGSNDGSSAKEPPMGNPDLNQMDDSEKRQAATLAADALLDTYKQLHHYGREFAKVPKQKLNQMYAKGELHPDLVLGDDITVSDLVEEYNDGCDTALQFDEEWGKKMKKPLVRIFIKRNIGMTDENYVMMEFGKDILTKGAVLYGMKKSINDTLKTISNQYVASMKPKAEPSPSQAKPQEPKMQEANVQRDVPVSDFPADNGAGEDDFIEHEIVD